MDIETGAYDEATRTVAVTFTRGDQTLSRPVNACHDAHGAYDAAATTARIAEVARGVAVKMDLGVVGANEPVPEPIVVPEPEPEPAADAPAE